MTDAELRRAFEEQRPALREWGIKVRDAIASTIRESIAPRKIEEFLKIPPEPRVKETKSFLAKALRRGKHYRRPLDQITDKVGVRFVILLRSELKIIERAIEGCPLWESQKDKDFASERAERPHHFDYQSVHYVVRARVPVACHDLVVPAGLACEVQVRTLLQHAYAELAHDRVYKPTGTIDSETVRQVAKSAALVETTDEIFVAVNDRLEAANAEIRRIHDLLAKLYRELVGPCEPDFGLSNAILDVYRDQLPEFTEDRVRKFLLTCDFAAEKIRERTPLSALYSHPIVLAVYFMAECDADVLPGRWPLDLRHLELIYADLGISTAERF